MARKTRKEKEISDARNLYKFVASPANTSNYAQTKTYAFAGNELTKTFILTLLILGFQIVLFISFKNHLINIPGISY